MTPNSRPSIGPLSSFRLAADEMCSRGMTQDVHRRLGRDVTKRDRPGRPRRRCRPGSRARRSAEKAVVVGHRGMLTALRRRPRTAAWSSSGTRSPDQTGHHVADVALPVAQRLSVFLAASEFSLRIVSSRATPGRCTKNASSRFAAYSTSASSSHGWLSSCVPSASDEQHTGHAPARRRSRACRCSAATASPREMRPGSVVRVANGSSRLGASSAIGQRDVDDQDDRQERARASFQSRRSPRARPNRSRALRATTSRPADSNAVAHLRLTVVEDAARDEPCRPA